MPTCKNCGIDYTPEMKNLEMKIEFLEKELEEEKERLATMKDGFCDGYCESNYEGFDEEGVTRPADKVSDSTHEHEL